MKTILETARLYIRPVTDSDVGGFFEMDHNPKVHTYLGNKPTQTKEESLEMIHFIQKQYIENGIGRMSVIEKETQTFIGWAGLKLIKDNVNGHTNFYDLGYRFIEDSWGKGYATEATNALIDYAFTVLNLENVYAIADLGNIASDKVLQKAGLKHIESFDYDQVPHAWYKITRREWQNK